jgi:hypothetical protein
MKKGCVEVILVCVWSVWKGLYFVAKFRDSVEGCDACEGWQWLPDVRQVIAIEIFFTLKKITVFSWRGSMLG